MGESRLRATDDRGTRPSRERDRNEKLGMPGWPPVALRSFRFLAGTWIIGAFLDLIQSARPNEKAGALLSETKRPSCPPGCQDVVHSRGTAVRGAQRRRSAPLTSSRTSPFVSGT
jgi:hypothetical protein